MFDFNYKKPVVIAEIGCNHKGEYELALDMLEIILIIQNIWKR